MKKRKPPIVLASLLIVLIGVAVIINMPKNQGPEQQGQKLTAEDAIPDGASRPTPTKDQLKQQLNAGTEQGDDERVASVGREGLKTNAKSSTIFLPRASSPKQVPNDSTVQAQWFRDNARANSPEGFKNP